MSTDGILDRVRKLLAKAEHPNTTQAERDAFNEGAAALIAKYGIEEALKEAMTVTDKPVKVGERIIFVPAPYAGEKAALLHNVGEPLRVKTVRQNGVRSAGFNVHCFGFAADLDRVELLFTSLLVQASYGLDSVQPGWGESPVTYRKSWMWGFIKAIRTRLDAAETKAIEKASQPGTAVVLADRKALVDRRAAELYTIKELPRVKIRGTGFRDGEAAGRRADLSDRRSQKRTNSLALSQ